jgi:membrane associated rhomboid family serine protease
VLPIGDDNSARRRIPFLTYILIIFNVILFIIELINGDPFIIRWSFIPLRFLTDPAGDFLTLFSSMFLHGSWLHLLGNMLYLWIFGDNVEDRFGHTTYLIFYLVCGLAATFAQMVFSLNSDIPHLGASGAIAGVLGAYILLFPKAQVRVLLMGIRIIPLPALVVIGFWIVLQFFSGVGSVLGMAEDGSVAYMAHVGGFIAGLLLALILRSTGRARYPSRLK